MGHSIPWLDRLMPRIRDWLQAFVREHVVDDDPWDPETVFGALMAAARPGRGS